MAANQPDYRLYHDLADWWPLISPPEEYAEEAAFAARLLRQARRPVREVLELGSGGGHCASHLSPGLTMTLADASAGMLAVSRRLNPGCEHVQADMRTIRLDRDFDAVFVHDAVDYMTTEADLRLVIDTAFVHCRPGGTAVFVPDHIAETFEPGTGYGGTDGPDGRAARYLDWAYDPDPGDTWTITQYAFLLREPGGEVRAVHETHRLGLFGRATWLRLLGDAGFQAGTVTEETSEDRAPRELFTGHRPQGPAGEPAQAGEPGLAGEPGPAGEPGRT
jgi:SAM-dependent methyltransferase